MKAQQVSDWETGRTPPGRRPMERLAKALRISVAGFEEGGPRPATLLQRPIGPRSLAEAGTDGAKAGDSAYANVRPPIGERARQTLEHELAAAVGWGESIPPDRLVGWLRLVRLAATSAGADPAAQLEATLEEVAEEARGERRHPQSPRRTGSPRRAAGD